MKYLLLILVILLSGCSYFSHQSTCRRKIENIQRTCQDCLDTINLKGRGDTTLPEKNINASIGINHPDKKVDSLVEEFANSMEVILNSNLECEKEQELLKSELTTMKKALQTNLKTVIHKNNYIADTFSVDTLGIQFKIWQQGGKFQALIKKRSENISVETETNAIQFNCPDCVPPKFYEDTWFWIWVSTILLLLVIAVFKFKIKQL